MTLICLPAILHNTPDKVLKAVSGAIEKHQTEFDHIFLAYADCGTGGALQAICNEHNIQMTQGPHYY